MRSDRTQLATDSLLCAVGDPLDALRGVKPGDADFADAQCVRIGAAVLAKLPSAMPRVEAAIAELAGQHLSPTELLHRDAGLAWVAGDPLRAIDRYAEIIAQSPKDLLALRLALSCCFFVGDHRRSCEIADSALRRYPRHEKGFGVSLALASFAHAEIGDAEFAEWLGRAALELDASCPLGVHAVAHAMVESGDSIAGADWMREQRAQWAVNSRMRTHNAWHLAMFDIDNGRHDSAFDILDLSLLPAADRWPLDACDAVALLWRLARAGIDVGRRWKRLSDAFQGFWEPGFWPYVDLHAAVAHGEAREQGRLRKLEAGIAVCAAGDDFAAARARRLTQPALRALDSWLAGDLEAAARQIAGVPKLTETGGSRAQIGVFVDSKPTKQNWNGTAA